MVEERPAAAPKREYQTRIAILLAARGGDHGARRGTDRQPGWFRRGRMGVGRARRGEARGRPDDGRDFRLREHGPRRHELPGVADPVAGIRGRLRLARRARRPHDPEFEALSILAQLHGEEARSLEEVVARDERYFVGGELGGGFDLQRKLADQRGEDLSAIEMPAAIRAEGDDLSKRGVAEALVGVLAAVAFLLGSVANALGRGRLLAWWAGAAVLAVAVGAAVVLEVAPVA